MEFITSEAGKINVEYFEIGRWGKHHRGRFLILTVKAGLGRQGGIVDKEDLIRTMVF
jgi:hypothetical protein